MSPEELEAAAAANAADAVAALDEAQAELAQLKAKTAELTEQALRAQAEAQNARRRADEEIAKSRKFAVEGFADVSGKSLRCRDRIGRDLCCCHTISDGKRKLVTEIGVAVIRFWGYQ